jgi:hypothetical protein
MIIAKIPIWNDPHPKKRLKNPKKSDTDNLWTIPSWNSSSAADMRLPAVHTHDGVIVPLRHSSLRFYRIIHRQSLLE